MKWFTKKVRLTALGVAVVLGVCIAHPKFARADQAAPGASPITQSSTRNDAAVNCLNANGTSQQTITMPSCGSAQYQYVTWIGSEAQATTAPAASNVTTTTTNLGGIQLIFGLTATAGIGNAAFIQPATPIKAALAGTASTVVSNAAITNVTFNISACWYCAP